MMKRRAFLKYGVIAGTVAAVHQDHMPPGLLAAEKKQYAQDIVTLGNTGIKVSRLAQGTGTRGYSKSSNQTRKLGIKGVAELLRTGVDQGLTYWDCADSYGSHPHVREALAAVKREKVVIMTKSWADTEVQMTADISGSGRFSCFKIAKPKTASWIWSNYDRPKPVFIRQKPYPPIPSQSRLKFIGLGTLFSRRGRWRYHEYTSWHEIRDYQPGAI